jgi:aerobic carbon-monoxide dehydrogenase medium subunit
MYAFTLEQPKTLADAKRFSGAGAQPLAGGQTLIASMKQRLLRPEQLVDLGGVAELRGVKVEGQTLVIGAMTCHQDVADNADVRKHIPGLAALAEGIGDRQVRARGTLGGSVANNDPAACYPSAVMGLGATVVTDRRQIAADDFFQGLYTTALEPGEIITAIRFPIPSKAAYAKFRQPASRVALVGVFVALTPSGPRVAITGTGNGVFRHAGLEAALAKSFTPDAVKDVKIDASDISGDLHASAAYRAHLVTVQTQVAVRHANG